MDDIVERIALMGLSPRQQRLLTLRAHVEGTQYAHLLPWEQDTDENGKRVLEHKRAPRIQLGIIPSHVERLADKLIGEGSFPSVDIAAASEDDAKAVADALWDDGLNLVAECVNPVQDLIVCGSGALAFHRTDLGWEHVYLEPEWTEPVFVSQVRTHRAREIAAQLAKLDWLTIPEDDDGPYLPAPEGAHPQDVAFVRYRIQFDVESAVREGGVAARTQTYWRQRDYLPDAIVEYEDVRVEARSNVAPAFVARREDPHNWGVVPVVWMRARGARAYDIDGPTLLTPALLSIARAADYAESRADHNIALNANPVLYRIDLKDPVAEQNISAGHYEGARNMETGPGAVADMQSLGNNPEVGYLETEGRAAAAAAAHVDRLASHASRVSGVVEFDQSKAAGTLSGTALERIMEPELARVRGYRGIVGQAIRLLVQKLARAMAAEGVTGSPDVEITVTWPRILPLTPEGVQAWAAALGAASGGPVISQESAVKLFANQVELDDAESEWERVHGDAEAAMQRMRDALPLPDPQPREDDPAEAA